MPNSSTVTPARRGRWARYNRWRAQHRDLDRQRRLGRRHDRHAEIEAVVMVEPPSAVALPTGSAPTHHLRVTVEIDGERRVFRATHIAGFGWMGHSGNTITKAIRLVMAHTPSS